MATVPDGLPGRIGCSGRHLVERVAPWAASSHAVAIDSTVMHARGGVWHKKHRGAVFLYQFSLLYRFEHGQDLRVGLKAFLKAA